VSRAPVELSVAESSDEDAWKAFVDSVPGAEVGHRWAFHEILVEVFGLEIVRLVARRGNDWVGVLPLVHQRSFVGRFLTSVPYLNYAGVLGTDADARASLASSAIQKGAELGVDRLELRGRDGADLPIDVWPGKASYELELPGASEALWASLAAKLRSQVKRPKKEGFEARVAGPEERDSFYALLARRWHELGSPVLPRRFFTSLERRFSGDLEYVLVARGGTIAAAGALLATSDRVEIPWAASVRAHDPAGVNMLLYWASLERAIARGARWFDFGRSTPGSGNARFKLQWGAVERPLGWNVRVLRARGRTAERGAGTRDLAASLWRKLPGPIAGRLGPYLAARIPY
jgi:FemAB-related protein (PEP-CTERM system-associated)